MPLCFAYGSNMDRAAMAARCPGALPVGLARLARHRPAMMREGYLTVVRAPRGEVWGLLWDVPLADLPALDRYESVGSGLYRKVHLPVVLEAGGSRRALVYAGSNAGPGVPRPGYLEGVLAAAAAVGLPAAAQAQLAALRGPGRGGLAAPEPVAPRIRPVRASPAGAPLGPAERLQRWQP